MPPARIGRGTFPRLIALSKGPASRPSALCGAGRTDRARRRPSFCRTMGQSSGPIGHGPYSGDGRSLGYEFSLGSGHSFTTIETVERWRVANSTGAAECDLSEHPGTFIDLTTFVRLARCGPAGRAGKARCRGGKTLRNSIGYPSVDWMLAGRWQDRALPGGGPPVMGFTAHLLPIATSPDRSDALGPPPAVAHVISTEWLKDYGCSREPGPMERPENAASR